MTNSLKEQFDQVSKKYDAQRPQLIPCFNDFYTICLPLIEELPSLKTVLDIGAGTGLFTQFIYQKRPDLHFTLIDISGEMLAVAKERFAGANNVSFHELDFSKGTIEQKYDLIISSLAIHHLEDSLKEALYQNIYNDLNPGGIFINADQVKGRTSWFDNYYKMQWQETISKSGLDETAINSALERIKLDKFGYLDLQLSMLDKIGFLEVDCIYKHNNFVVFAGLK
ncbi:class I SAM-dependent methyltransferase [Mucilaginibacter robiniae]|uniref:Class I SAM-dependent methyltransferase n=1 Tax=Mucilaginibacter robiniae TaxID=2728022 RepID=A0A7L5E2G6_9SPHI|nr:class I SAM-dependent methyltransferase [Mucilaginibacter robiniae]QJD97221.1 class I SAM-dependent methyltransferase [Mucilaginibacter robiniae]